MTAMLWRALTVIAAANAGRDIYLMPPMSDNLYALVGAFTVHQMAAKNAKMNAALLAADKAHAFNKKHAA